jgi:hypothetical protein
LLDSSTRLTIASWFILKRSMKVFTSDIAIGPWGTEARVRVGIDCECRGWVAVGMRFGCVCVCVCECVWACVCVWAWLDLRHALHPVERRPHALAQSLRVLLELMQ